MNSGTMAGPEARPAGAPLVAWVLQAWPFSDHAGQHRWLASLMAEAASAGFRSAVVLPRLAGLPVLGRPGSAATEVCARDVHVLPGGLTVLPLRAALWRLAWVVYLRLPPPVQQQVARCRRARRRRSGVDHVLGVPLDASAQAWVHGALERLGPAVVVLDSAFMVGGHDVGAPVAILAHDVIHERAAALRALGYSVTPAEVDARWEAERLLHADAIVAIQWDDAAVLRDATEGVEVVVAPPSFTVRPPTAARVVPGRCLVVGSGAIHNADGAQWLLEEVWPEVRRHRPAATLRVVGSVGSQLAPPLPEGVELVGVVEDLDAEYEAAQLVLVPLRAGSGLKVKLVEALTHGSAVVTTPAGAQGLGSLRPPPFVVAEGAERWREELVRLLDDGPAVAGLREEALSAARRFDREHAGTELRALLRRWARR